VISHRGAASSRAHLDEEQANRTGPWTWLSVAGALLAMAGSVVGLVDVGGVYGKETASLVNQAIAQDAVNLIVVSPAILVLAVLTRRGSLRA